MIGKRLQSVAHNFADMVSNAIHQRRTQGLHLHRTQNYGLTKSLTIGPLPHELIVSSFRLQHQHSGQQFCIFEMNELGTSE